MLPLFESSSPQLATYCSYESCWINGQITELNKILIEVGLQ